jgi:hypothetical protein
MVVKKLPEISEVLLSVMEHYQPIAREIFPSISDAAVLDKALEFEGIWLRSESQKAVDIFIARQKKEAVTASAS